MKHLGLHVLAELYGCTWETLDDLTKVKEIMVNAALTAGAEVRECVFHKFSPQGVSGVVVISESHLTIHTWPEFGYAAVDVFTCGKKVDPWKACHHLKNCFFAKQMTTKEFKRGLMPCSMPQVVVNL
jgi:S-adenosylmethionine decarboxylase